VEPQTLDDIEARVNARIRDNVKVMTEEMEAEKAFKSGAMALFEEKYGDRVRVVSLGNFSKELCGGTHTEHTGNIGLFKIVSESSIASGVRRIEALTGAPAIAHVQNLAQIVRQSTQLFKDKPEAVIGRIENLLAALKSADKETEKLKAKIAELSSQEGGDQIQTIDGVKVLARQVQADSPAALRDLADRLKDKLQSGIVALGSVAEGKVFLIVGVTKDLAGRYHAGKIVKEAAALVGGGGGGRPDMAQAGGSRPENLEQALAKVYEVVKRM
jgi:alanyl-tRNA synthetase